MRAVVPKQSNLQSIQRKLSLPGHLPLHLDISRLLGCGNGVTICTEILQREIDECAANGGGTVYIPSGVYLTGTLWMRSNVTLHLEAGAKLQGVPDVAAFPIWVSHWEGTAKPMHAALICGEGLENIAIIGRGSIDGGGSMWWDLFKDKKLSHIRPRLIRVVNCRNVLIDGITLTNSGFWTLNPVACDNVTISRVTIKNPPDSPNTDGINPDSCSNVRISDCYIDVGDDCVTIKSGSEEDGRAMLRASENITITNCTMLHGHGGVVIGSETSGGVRNVVISNCVFCGTDRGIRLKSRRGRGGVVEDVRVDNLIMDEVLCPLVVNLFYVCGAEDSTDVHDRSAHLVDSGTPRIRRLRFSNISARRVKYAAAFLLGLPEMCVEDVIFDGISVYLDPDNTSARSPAMAAGVVDMCRAGFMIKNARMVKLRNIDVHHQLGPAVSIGDADDVAITDLCAQREDEGPLVTMENVQPNRNGNGHPKPATAAAGSSRRKRGSSLRSQ
jgi:polygalacturonase